MEFTKAEDIKKMVGKVIKEERMEYINLNDIEVVRVDKDIKIGDHLVLGRCIALGELTKFLSGMIYCLQFPPAFDLLENEDDKTMIIHHELLHIPLEGKGVVNHDIEEFKKIFEKYPRKIYSLVEDIERKRITIKEIEKKEKQLKKLKEENKDKESEEENGGEIEVGGEADGSS